MNRKGFLGRLLVAPFVGKALAEVEPLPEVSVPFVQDNDGPTADDVDSWKYSSGTTTTATSVPGETTHTIYVDADGVQWSYTDA